MNINKIKRNQVLLVLVIVFGIAIISRNIIKSVEVPQVEIVPKNEYSQTLNVYADIDYPPYSYIDENNKMQGYDVELMYSLAEILKVNINLELLEWSEVIKKIENKEADIVLGLEYTDKYRNKLNLSDPTVLNEFVVFGMNKSNIQLNIYDSKLGILRDSEVYELFIKPNTLEKNTVYLEDTNDAFEAISNEEIDYFIGRYAVGKYILKEENIKNIKVIGDAIYKNTFCIGVEKENEKLLKDINKALLILYENKTRDTLRAKWIDKYANVDSIREFVYAYNIEIMLSICIIILASIYRYRLFQKDNMKKMYEKERREYIEIVFSIVNKIHDVLFIFDITNDKIADNQNHEYFSEYKLEKDISYTKYLEVDCKLKVYDDYKEGYMNIFSIDNLLKNHKQKNDILEYQYLRLVKDNTYQWFEDRLHIYERNQNVKMIIFRENIHIQKEKELNLIKKSEKDLFTDFYNKISVELIINKILQTSSKNNNILILLDIDNFKNVNDTYGHLFGDKVISLITKELKSIFRYNDIFGRIGGDEFVVFLRDSTDIDNIRKKGNLICDLIKNIVVDKDISYKPTISIGIAQSHECDSFEEIYKRADKALYESKKRGKNKSTVYDDIE